MKIGLDVRTLETGHQYRGIGVYSKNLIKAISQLDEDNPYTFFCQSLPSPVHRLIKNPRFKFSDYLVRKTNDPAKYNWYLDQFYLPQAIRKSGVDLVHFLEQLSVPQIRPTKTIVSIMDHFQVTGDQVSTKNIVKFFAAKKADKIITISHFIKKELIRSFNIPEEKIVVTHLGYDREIYQPEKDCQQLAAFRLKNTKNRKYLVYTGSLGDYEKRKNLDFLAKIFIKVAQKNHDVDLVMIGKFGSEGKRIRQLFINKKLDHRVLFTDYVADKTVSDYLRAAEIFLFPSSEGFGLPPLEAMACGTPVVAADTSSLPEVIGQAGILLNLHDEDLWVKTILNLIGNNKLGQELSKKGLMQAAHFSWEKCARQTLEVYQEVLNAKN